MPIVGSFAAWLLGQIPSWLFGQVADAGRKRVSVRVLGTDQDRALRRVADIAVERTARELSPGARERAAEIAMVVNQVFANPVPPAIPSEDATLLELIQAQIYAQLAPLDDPELTGTGVPSAALLGVSATKLAETLTSHLLREIVVQGSRGGPLTALASQLNHDKTQLQGKQLTDMVARVVAALPARDAPAGLPGLPRDVASFIGRTAELRQLRRAMPGRTASAGTVRVVAIHGMAGVGKTAFAVHAAHRLAGRFPDGQLFISLHGHTPGQRPDKPAEVLAALLLMDGVAPQQIPAGLHDRAGLWRSRIAGRKMLLLLDDAASTQQVQPLLPGSAGILVLLTSRRRLTALPDALPVALNLLAAEDAARLYISLAGRADLHPGDEAVSKIAALCGHLPLAISLTASQVKYHRSWSIAYQAAELAAAKDRLAMMEAEHLSVTAAFDLSYRQLAAGQQLLFRRLGLHPGTDFDAYAAAALGNVQLAAARKLLDDLFGYNLIQEPDQGRYRLHDLVRERARSLAAADPAADREAAIGRLLSYYLSTAHAADRHLARRTSALAHTMASAGAPAQSPALLTRKDAVSWMDAERVNLAAAAIYAADHDQPGYAIAIAAAMDGYLRARGHWDQARALQHLAIEAAGHAGDQLGEASALNDLGAMQIITGNTPESIGNITRSLDLYRSLGSKQGEANAVHNLGKAQDLAGDRPAAVAGYTQALGLYRDLGDSLGLARTHLELGLAQQRMDVAASIVTLTKALELYGDLGQLDGQAASYNSLAESQMHSGDLPGAIVSDSRALDLFQELGNQQGEAFALLGLGTCQAHLGDYRAAIVSLGHAADLARGLHDLRTEAGVLAQLGPIQLAIADYPAALATETRALKVFREVGDTRGQAGALAHLSAMQATMGDFAAALTGEHEALETFRGLGDLQGQAVALAYLGFMHRAIDDYAAALASEQEAVEIFRSIGDLQGQAGAVAYLGDVRLAMGEYPAALASEQEAAEIFRGLGDPQGQAAALTHLGAVQHSLGEYPAAAASLASALDLFRRSSDPLGEADVLNHMGELELASASPGQARSRYEHAHAIAARIGSPLQQARALEGIGRCHLQDGLPDSGISHLRQALAIYQRIGSPRANRVVSSLGARTRS